MGFREDVPLDGFIDLTPFASEVLLGQPDAGARFGGTPSFFGMTAPRTREVDDRIYQLPYRHGHGPVARSTCQEVEPWPSVVWDVNGYYHALGVGYKATRKQLLAAYVRLNGQDDDYLTYVFKQLLDPATRRRYDSAQLGSMFVDRYVEQDLKALARRLAAVRHADPADLLEEWGFEVECPEDGPVEGFFAEDHAEAKDPVDIPKESGEDLTTAPAEEPEIWPYSYYLWRIRPRHIALDSDAIARQWQDAIATQCQKLRAVIQFAVGLTGETGEEDEHFQILSVRGTTVVFIELDHLHDMNDIAPQAAHRLTLPRD